MADPRDVQPHAGIEPHAVLNGLDAAAAAQALRRACGAERWVQRMLGRRPFASSEALYASADDEWRASSREDYLEAFSHHPRIGEDMSALRQRFQSTAGLSAREQAGVASADEATLCALRDANAAYRERFGFIFIICATGKTANEMLGALRARLMNDADTELSIAADEHAQITRLRLASLGTREPHTSREPVAAPKGEGIMSGISCHVLDTTLGRPAAGIEVRLERLLLGNPDEASSWHTLGQVPTNADGRASDLEVASARELGRHRISFELEEYLRRTGQAIFYPRVQVQFIVESPSDSYHIPLLLSPFGYSTYRGS